MNPNPVINTRLAMQQSQNGVAAKSPGGSIINSGGGLHLLSKMSQSLHAMLEAEKQPLGAPSLQDGAATIGCGKDVELAPASGVQTANSSVGLEHLIANMTSTPALSSNVQSDISTAQALSALLPPSQYTPAEIQVGVEAAQAVRAASQQNLLGNLLKGMAQPYMRGEAQSSNASLGGNSVAAAMMSLGGVPTTVAQPGSNGHAQQLQQMQTGVRDRNSSSSSSTGTNTRTVDKVQAKRAANRLHSRQSRKRKKDFIEGLKEQTELLQRTKAMLEILPVVILSHNREGIITYAIAATKRLLDYTVNDLMGMNFYALLGKESVQAAKRACPPEPDTSQNGSGDGNDSSESADSQLLGGLQVTVNKRSGEEVLFEMDTKRFSRDEIVRYLQLAKSDLSSSSSNSSTSPPSSHDSSEDGVSNSSGETGSGSATTQKRSSKRQKKLSTGVSSSSQVSASSGGSHDGNSNSNVDNSPGRVQSQSPNYFPSGGNDRKKRGGVRQREAGAARADQLQASRERMEQSDDGSPTNGSNSPPSSNDNDGT